MQTFYVRVRDFIRDSCRSTDGKNDNSFVVYSETSKYGTSTDIRVSGFNLPQTNRYGTR